MNNGTIESSPSDRIVTVSRTQKNTTNLDELSRLKRELLQAEVRLAKARANAAGAEIDIKVLNTRLIALTQ